MGNYGPNWNFYRSPSLVSFLYKRFGIWLNLKIA